MPLFVNDGKSPIDAAGISQTEHNALDHTGLAGLDVASLFQSGTPTTSALTFSMPAGTLAVDGDYVEVVAWGAITGGISEVELVFALTQITTLAGLTDASTWNLSAVILRTGALAQQVTSLLSSSDAGGLTIPSAGAQTKDLTTILNITVGKAGGGVGQTQVQGMIVRKWSAP